MKNLFLMILEILRIIFIYYVLNTFFLYAVLKFFPYITENLKAILSLVLLIFFFIWYRVTGQYKGFYPHMKKK